MERILENLCACFVFVFLHFFSRPVLARNRRYMQCIEGSVPLKCVTEVCIAKTVLWRERKTRKVDVHTIWPTQSFDLSGLYRASLLRPLCPIFSRWARKFEKSIGGRNSSPNIFLLLSLCATLSVCRVLSLLIVVLKNRGSLSLRVVHFRDS